MNAYNSSPSHISNETHGSPSASSPSFYVSQQSVSFQGDSSQIQSPSQTSSLTLFQDQVAQSNSPTSPQLSDYIGQQHFSAQGDTNLAQIPPQTVTSAALSRDQVAQPNSPTPLQLSPSFWQETSPVHGDAIPIHISPQLVSPVPSPNPVSRTNARTSPKQHSCPNCKKFFDRRQELKRHVLSNLPHCILCPFPRCGWTGNRLYSLIEHTKVHPNFNSGREPERKKCQIYDPKKLVESMARGTLAVEKAADIALSMVEERLAEPDKAGVEVNVWGNRKRFCKAKS